MQTSHHNIHLRSFRYLTTASSEKRVILLDLDCNDLFSTVQYQPGDSIAIHCSNDPVLVESIIQRLSATSGDSSNSESLTHQLLYKYDITGIPSKGLIKLLADHTSSAEEKEKLLHLWGRNGRDDFKDLFDIKRTNLLELLEMFPSSNPPIDQLVSKVAPLQPRLYSLTNSPSVHGNLVSVAFTVVEIPIPSSGVVKKGLCSSWLESICIKAAEQLSLTDLHSLSSVDISSLNITIPISFRPSAVFHLPSNDPCPPLVMIGPGTGVAPFIGFLHELSTRPSRPNSWLFFGCRSESQDFIFRTDLEGFVSNGVVSKLVCAFSRDQDDKVYVQHKLEENAEDLLDLLLKEKGIIYVCGDVSAMAKDVQKTIQALLETRMEAAEAAAYFATMLKEKRYVMEIWS